VYAKVEEGPDGLQVGESPLFLGLFVFDPVEKMVGSPGGIQITTEASPIPLVLFGLGHNFSGSMYADYANLILDVSEVSAQQYHPMMVARQITVEGVQCCYILIDTQELDQVFISSQYTVFPDDARTMVGTGPFATLSFDLSPGIQGTLVVQRGGEQVERVEVSGTDSPTILLEKVSSVKDYVEWYVENESKDITHRGVLGLPMSGASPKLVQYAIDVNSETRVN